MQTFAALDNLMISGRAAGHRTFRHIIVATSLQTLTDMDIPDKSKNRTWVIQCGGVEPLRRTAFGLVFPYTPVGLQMFHLHSSRGVLLTLTFFSM